MLEFENVGVHIQVLDNFNLGKGPKYIFMVKIRRSLYLLKQISIRRSEQSPGDALYKIVSKISQSSQEKQLCRSLFLIKLQIFGLEEAPTQVFACDFCEMFLNTFFYRTPPVAAS